MYKSYSIKASWSHLCAAISLLPRLPVGPALKSAVTRLPCYPPRSSVLRPHCYLLTWCKIVIARATADAAVRCCCCCSCCRHSLLLVFPNCTVFVVLLSDAVRGLLPKKHVFHTVSYMLLYTVRIELPLRRFCTGWYFCHPRQICSVSFKVDNSPSTSPESAGHQGKPILKWYVLVFVPHSERLGWIAICHGGRRSSFCAEYAATDEKNGFVERERGWPVVASHSGQHRGLRATA